MHIWYVQVILGKTASHTWNNSWSNPAKGAIRGLGPGGGLWGRKSKGRIYQAQRQAGSLPWPSAQSTSLSVLLLPNETWCYLPTDLCFHMTLSQLTLLINLFAGETLAFPSWKLARKKYYLYLNRLVCDASGTEATATLSEIYNPDNHLIGIYCVQWSFDSTGRGAKI